MITENTAGSLYCGLSCYREECALNVKVQMVQTPGNNLYSAHLESAVIRFTLILLICECGRIQRMMKRPAAGTYSETCERGMGNFIYLTMAQQKIIYYPA